MNTWLSSRDERITLPVQYVYKYITIITIAIQYNKAEENINVLHIKKSRYIYNTLYDSTSRP